MLSWVPVEPGNSAAQWLYVQSLVLVVFDINVGDFQLSEPARLDFFNNLRRIVVVEVDSRHHVVAFGLFRFFKNFNRAFLDVERNQAVTFELLNVAA